MYSFYLEKICCYQEVDLTVQDSTTECRRATPRPNAP